MTKPDWGGLFDKVRRDLGLGRDKETETVIPAISPDQQVTARPESSPTPTPGIREEKR